MCLSLRGLKNVLGVFFSNKLFADVNFILGSGETEKSFPAHRLILAAASPLFECMLYPRDDLGESVIPLTKSPILVKLPAVDPVGFESLLRCIYTDELDVTAQNIQSLLNLASKYQVEKVQAACTDFLEGDITKDNVLEFFQIAPKMLGDEEFGVAFIEDNASDVLASEAFVRLSEERFLKILQCENLCCEEIELFNAILGWTKEHYKTEKKDVKEQEKKDVKEQEKKRIKRRRRKRNKRRIQTSRNRNKRRIQISRKSG